MLVEKRRTEADWRLGFKSLETEIGDGVELAVEGTLPAELEGTLYRIDLRLRPEGDAGPLVRGLGSYENFYAQWGQTWERMMLIKARRVAGLLFSCASIAGFDAGRVGGRTLPVLSCRQSE